MKVRCPICGEISKTDAMFASGDALECPYCKGEFIYGVDSDVDAGASLVSQQSKIQNSTLQSEVVFKRFYDPIILEKIRLGDISNLQDREMWQKILITLKVRKPVPVVCDKCWRFNVGFFRDKGEVVRCQCGQEFSANHGNNAFLSLVTAMQQFVEKGKDIYFLHTDGIEENVGRMERILGYYYDVKEEFTGVDRDSARMARLQARTGYTSGEELPKLYQNEDISKCQTIIEAIDYTIRTRARSACMWVLPLGGTSALLMVGVAVFVSIHATNGTAIWLFWIIAILWCVFWISLTIDWIPWCCKR